MQTPTRHRLAAFCVPAALALGTAGADELVRTEANVMVELTLTARLPHADPFNDVALDVMFSDPNGREFQVPAFWAGGSVWKVRYASPVVGAHSFRSECSEALDTGLHGIAGRVEIKPYTGQNPLYAHGPLKVSANRRYLEYGDGAPFFWLGDTWWMGLCHRMTWPDDFQKLAADRKAKGFNVIQIVAGLYPDMHPFDPRGANEAGFPWAAEYARIRPEYFDAADTRLHYLVDQGFTPCLVGAWGYFIQWMGLEKAKRHWRYLLARYAALPVVWCVAGEANLPWYLAPGFPYDDRHQVTGWTAVMRYLREIDPFHRLTTIHPTGIGRLSARNATDDVLLLDVDMLQTPHGQREAVPPTVATVRESHADTPIMPVINGEASYEMLNDTIPAEWPRAMFWVCMLNGAAGHTYGANGIWQVNRRGQPHGPSPHQSGGNGYGTIPWDEAMNLPGSRQVGLGKRLFERYPWQKFMPHPEWVSFAGNSRVSLEGTSWIWGVERGASENARVGKHSFRRSFSLPGGKPVRSARMFVTADDAFTLWLNGQRLGSAQDWRAGRQFDDFTQMLKPGENVLAILAENRPAPVPANPAGLLVQLEIKIPLERTVRLGSDTLWRCHSGEVPEFEKPGFDDSTWDHPTIAARYGEAPWGKAGAGPDLIEPQAAGIDGGFRIIWVPERRPVVVHQLGSHSTWSVERVDPTTGERFVRGKHRINDAGALHCDPPLDGSADWVLTMEPEK